jgi:outer membrane protein OmpA-like peptidoglycan-associated protein
LLGVVLAVLALCVLATGAYVYMTVARPPALDRASLCPLDGPRSVTVVLLDSANDIPDIGKHEIRTVLIDMAETLPVYGLLELRLLDPNVPGGRSIFARCNPGDGSGLNEYTANPRLARKRWMEGFRQPLDQALEEGFQPAPGQASPIIKTSPIMENVQRIAVDRFTGRAAENIPKSLVLVSDMLEHQPDYSQYTGDLSYSRYKASRAYNRLQTNLHGAEVTIYYIQRVMTKPISWEDHNQFWVEWFRDNKGRFKQANKLQGLLGAIEDLKEAGVTVTESARPVAVASGSPPTREVKIYLPTDVLFDFDKADLRPEAASVLERVANVVRSDPKAAPVIEGHTDGMGPDQYNQALSERRAQSVRQWLVRHGVTAGMAVRGWGRSKPVEPNSMPNGADNPEGRQKNRRVEITFTTAQ